MSEAISVNTAEVAEDTAEKTVEYADKYPLRELQAQDIFTMTSIISAIGVKEFKACLDGDKLKTLLESKDKGLTNNDVKEVGIDIILNAASIVLANLPKAESQIYQLLSDLSGMPKENIKSLDMAIFTDMVMRVFHKEEFRDFIGVVSRYVK